MEKMTHMVEEFKFGSYTMVVYQDEKMKDVAITVDRSVNQYLPNIYAESREGIRIRDFSLVDFRVQTTSFGLLDENEFKLHLGAQYEAAAAIAELSKNLKNFAARARGAVLMGQLPSGK